MKHPASVQPLVVALALALSGCRLITFDCGGPEYRWANAKASIADAADTLKADVYVGVSDQRGGGQATTHSFSVIVEAMPRRTSVLPLPSLFGHATNARIERADGTVVLRLPLHTESNSVGTIATTVQEGVAQSVFDYTRDELLANHLFVTILVDDSVPALRRGAIAVLESHDWAKRACQ